MGVERSVTRWYLRRQLVLGEIEQLETRRALAAASPGEQEDASILEDVDSQIAAAEKKLKALGHCPKPMMG